MPGCAWVYLEVGNPGIPVRHPARLYTPYVKAQAEPTAPKRSIFSRLIEFLKPYRGFFIIGVLLTLIISVLNPIRPYLIQYVLDHPVAEGDLYGLRFWIAIIIGLVVLQTLLMYVQILVTNWIGQSVIHDMRQRVFDHILSLRLRFFDTHAVGALQTRSINDIETLSNIFSNGLVTIVGEMLQLVFITALMFYTDWRITLVILGILPLLLLATYIFRRFVSEAFNRVRKYVSELNTFIQEHLTGMLITQIFSQEAREHRRFQAINALHRKAHVDTIFYYSIFFPAVELVSALATALIVWYGTAQVLEGRTTFGALVAFLMYTQMFFRPIRMLADQFNALQLSIVSGRRIFRVLDTDEHIPEAPDAVSAEPLTREQVDIVFREVRFSYTGKEEVLRGISFAVPAGKTTAIVGTTGAGKSSIVNVLKRFYDIQSGEIEVGGVDIRKYELEAYRAAIGLVMQDAYLFSGSIHDNITLHNPAFSREQVERAAAEIGADRFIQQLPGGYDFQVGERGSSLSTGQRQLLAFIRILVYDPKILLLDEATANIDSETEAIIQDAIARLLSHRTSIIIAHRLSTIQKAHQILVMRRGEIIERGNHHDLLALDGYYRKLYLLHYGQRISA